MSEEDFKQRLNANHSWPCEYTFKFIIPVHKQNELIALVGNNNIQEKSSKNGRYISVTAIKFVSSAEDVLGLYKKISSVQGVISL